MLECNKHKDCVCCRADVCFWFLSLMGYEGLEVINPEGSTEDAEEEAGRGRWKQEVYILLLFYESSWDWW